MAIPFQGEPIESFGKGMAQGHNLIQQLLARRQMEQQAQQFTQNMAMKQQMQEIRNRQQSRLEQMMPIETAYKLGKAQESAGLGQFYQQLFNPQSVNALQPSSEQFQGREPMAFGTQVPLPAVPNARGVEQPQNYEALINKMNSFSPETAALASSPSAPEEGASTVISPGNPDLYFADRAAGKMPGFSPPNRVVEDGYQITTWPSGKIDKIKIAPSKEDMKASEGMGEYRAKTYSEANDAAMNYQAQQDNFDKLVQDLEDHPNPEQVIGPMNKYFAQFFGSPEDQEFIGSVMATTGNVVLEAAKNIKGAFTGRDQSLINSMKPNANDPFHIFLGKLKTLSELNSLSEKRMEIYAEKVEQGTRPNQAMKEAHDQTKFEGIGDKYKKMVKFNQNRVIHNKGQIPDFNNEMEAEEFYRSLGVAK